MSLTKEAIFKARKVTKVNVPEWGGEVSLRSLSVGEMLSLRELSEKAQEDAALKHEIGLHILAYTVCDDAGEPLFADAGEVRKAPQEGLAKLMPLALKQAGMGGDDAPKN